MTGLEPARVSPLPPQSSVSAYSTTCAYIWQQAGYIPFLLIEFRTSLRNTLSSFDSVIPYS